MAQQLKAGGRFRSGVCDTEIIVVKAPADPVDLRIGGQPVLPVGEEKGPGGTPEAPHDTGTELGKRYADEALGIEVLCTKAGKGSLSVGDEPLAIKGAKPLPSSD